MNEVLKVASVCKVGIDWEGEIGQWIGYSWNWVRLLSVKQPESNRVVIHR